MRKTASEIIRDLEIRIARLEKQADKEAGFLDSIGISLDQIAGEISSTINLMIRKDSRKIIDAMAENFQSRIGGAMSGTTFGSDFNSRFLDRPEIRTFKLSKFDPKNPLNSWFTDHDGTGVYLKDAIKADRSGNLFEIYDDWIEMYGPILARAQGKEVKLSNELSSVYEKKALSLLSHLGGAGRAIFKAISNIAIAPSIFLGMVIISLVGGLGELVKKIIGLVDITPSLGRVASEDLRRYRPESPRMILASIDKLYTEACL